MDLTVHAAQGKDPSGYQLRKAAQFMTNLVVFRAEARFAFVNGIILQPAIFRCAADFCSVNVSGRLRADFDVSPAVKV
jgi:hypothetical protein